LIENKVRVKTEKKIFYELKIVFRINYLLNKYLIIWQFLLFTSSLLTA
jgi:hypothetical protein